MAKMLTVAWKELLLLARDYGGILVLFLMPAVLVLVITLVQENVMELTGEQVSTILFIDEDQGEVGRELAKALGENESVELLTWEARRKGEALEAVADGSYSVCLLLPKGVSKSLEERVGRLFAKSGEATEEKDPALELQLFFDPAVLPGFRNGITAMVRMAMGRVEMEKKLAGLTTNLRTRLQEVGIPEEYLSGERFGIDGLQGELLRIREESGGKGLDIRPGVVQQNVPAWALFGMFFTVMPLGGALLRERRSGVWARFLSMPLATISLLGGKVLAYCLVCLLQFGFIYLIGNQLFPLFNLPAFTIGGALLPVVGIVLAASLAACGYGLMLGTVCGSYEQVSMFGSISIVIGAALGGIMVPVYAMPEALREIAVFSPLNWGLTAFHEVLIRGNGLVGAGQGVSFLLLFFLVNFLVAWKLARPSK